MLAAAAASCLKLDSTSDANAACCDSVRPEGGAVVLGAPTLLALQLLLEVASAGAWLLLKERVSRGYNKAPKRAFAASILHACTLV